MLAFLPALDRAFFDLRVVRDVHWVATGVLSGLDHRAGEPCEDFAGGLHGAECIHIMHTKKRTHIAGRGV